MRSREGSSQKRPSHCLTVSSSWSRPFTNRVNAIVIQSRHLFDGVIIPQYGLLVNLCIRLQSFNHLPTLGLVYSITFYAGQDAIRNGHWLIATTRQLQSPSCAPRQRYKLSAHHVLCTAAHLLPRNSDGESPPIQNETPVQFEQTYSDSSSEFHDRKP